MQQTLSVMRSDWVKVCEDGSRFDPKYLTSLSGELEEVYASPLLR